jgi:glycosyltransferase involved in cell wall biosynthesis
MIKSPPRPLSVLMISPQFRPLYGGYERAAERLSRALVEAGLRVEVVTERRDPAWPASEVCDGFRIRRVWTVYRRHLHALTSLIGFGGYLLRHGRRFDIWHVHQYGFQAALAVVLGRLLRRPVVLKLTNSAAMGIEKALLTDARTTARLLAFLHRRVSACVAITDETRDEATRFGIPINRIHLVPNGLPADEFRPASAAERAEARQRLALDCETLVLSVARLSD